MQVRITIARQVIEQRTEVLTGKSVKDILNQAQLTDTEYVVDYTEV